MISALIQQGRVGMCAWLHARVYVPAGGTGVVESDQRRSPQRRTTTGTRWTRAWARLAREASRASFLAVSECGSYTGSWFTSIPAFPLGPPGTDDAATAEDDDDEEDDR